MGFKLVEQIQLMKHIPAKYKRILMAMAQRSRNDGTNFYESKETIAGKASASRWTVYRNLEDLVAAKIVIEATSHECKKEGCTKGSHHMIGNGHWTQAYNIDLAALQSATRLDVAQCSKSAKPRRSKAAKTDVAKCDAILGCDPRSCGTGDEDDPFVLPDKKEMKEGKNPPSLATLAPAECSDAAAAANTADVPSTPTEPELQETKPDTIADSGMTLEEFIDYVGKETFQQIERAWFDRTGASDAYQQRDLTAKLLWENGGLEEIPALVRAMLFDCPETAKVKWFSWEFFCKNFPKTLRNYKAWEAGNKARLREKAELSKHGACVLCGIKAASYNRHCSDCDSKFRCACNLLDRAEKTKSAIWRYTDDTLAWIGDGNGLQLFHWLPSEDFNSRVKRLMDLPDTMSKIEAFLDNADA